MLVGDLRKFAGHALGGLAGHLRPRGEHEALGGIARGHSAAGGGVIRGRVCFLFIVLLIFIIDATSFPALGGSTGLASLRGVGGFVALRDHALDHRDDIIHRGITQRLHLQRGKIKVVLHPVLDAHAHERIQAQVDERQFAGQIFNVVAHGLRDD